MKKRWNVMAVLTAVALFAAACGGASTNTGGSSAPSEAEETPVAGEAVQSASLRIARESGPSSGLLFIADRQGYLTEQGLDYEIVSFANGSEAVDALQAKQIQVAFGAADTFPIRGGGSGLVGLAAVSQQPSAVSIVVSGDVESPEDLKGKTIGVVPNTVSQFVLENIYLAGAGLTPEDYEVVGTGPAEMVALMARGDISAFALWDPFPAHAAESLGEQVKIIATAGELGIPNTTYLLVNEPTLADEAYASAYSKLLAGLKQAQEFLASNPDESAFIIGEATQLTQENMLKRLEEIRLEVFMDDSATEEIENYNDILTSTGAVAEKVDVTAVLDTSLLSALDD